MSGTPALTPGTRFEHARGNLRPTPTLGSSGPVDILGCHGGRISELMGSLPVQITAADCGNAMGSLEYRLCGKLFAGWWNTAIGRGMPVRLLDGTNVAVGLCIP